MVIRLFSRRRVKRGWRSNGGEEEGSVKSLLIEFHRFKNLDKGMLREGDDYLVAAATHPVREVRMTLDQDCFLDQMLNLRYQGGAAEREASLRSLSEVVTGMLGPQVLKDLETGEFPLQLDLVVNAAELAALPFETASDAAGQPLLVRRERPVELTRRIRNDFAETAMRWPSRPRILFAWARPDEVTDVPHEQHEKALRAALEPWMPAPGGAGGPLTVLSKAGIASLQTICADSIAAGKPFTHVHILAHGYPIGHDHRKRFGIALHDEEGNLDAVPPEDLKEALALLCGHAVVVTLATCDAANMTNTITTEKSVAHELHKSGFPVVLASQLPLTVPGSTILVERFYGGLLAGKDVRTALHEARTALYENRNRTGHDWASLVGYVRLPEGYAEYLQEVRLDAVMASLKIARDRSVAGTDLAQLDEIAELLHGRIQALEAFLPETEKHPREAVLQENLGLLGSAQKRLADLLFQRGRLSPSEDWRPPVREALTSAREWYRRGYERNLSHHWTGVQYLCLDAVLDGTISNPSYWHAAVSAAKIQAAKEKEFWPYGSLAELYLLAPLAGQPAMLEEAAKALETMRRRVLQYNGEDRFPLDSTDCQLCRYRDWWTAANGFFPGRAADLAAEVEGLIAVLKD
jgi:CHAT domain-containing protein